MSLIYIDGENIPYTQFDAIKRKYLNDNIPVISMKVYADWSREDMKKWYVLCTKYSIDQKQCSNKPKKDVVDFHICIDIMDDIYNDILNKTNHIKKILIISADGDFIHILNRINKFNIIAEVYSPFVDKMDTYHNHASLFDMDTPITISKKMFECLEDNRENCCDEDDSSDNSSVYDDERYKFYFNQSEDSIKQNIQMGFLWYNPRKHPYKDISLSDFKKSLNQLIDNNVIHFIDSCEVENYITYPYLKQYTKNNIEYLQLLFEPSVCSNRSIIMNNLISFAFQFQNAHMNPKTLRSLTTDARYLNDKNITGHQLPIDELNKTTIATFINNEMKHIFTSTSDNKIQVI